MSDGLNSVAGEAQTATGFVRVIGYPGSFTGWGLDCVRAILQAGGYGVQVIWLDQSPIAVDEADSAVRVQVGHGPVVAQTNVIPSRTIVFLDTIPRAFHELLVDRHDPVEASRALTGTLAILASILREDDVLVVQRTSEMDPIAIQSTIASHIAGVLPLPDGLTPDCPPIDTLATHPPLVGQALSLLRQMLTPLANFVVNGTRNPIVWPLACFYSGDYPTELASPFIEVVGRGRILYYGPYFHLPRGHWRADIQIIVSGNMHDKKLTVDVYAGAELARHDFKPEQGGLLQASLPFAVERTEQQNEIRVWLGEGVIEGYLGLKQVLIQPIES